jgi:hypothetical protein
LIGESALASPIPTTQSREDRIMIRLFVLLLGIAVTISSTGCSPSIKAGTVDPTTPAPQEEATEHPAFKKVVKGRHS